MAQRARPHVAARSRIALAFSNDGEICTGSRGCPHDALRRLRSRRRRFRRARHGRGFKPDRHLGHGRLVGHRWLIGHRRRARHRGHVDDAAREPARRSARGLSATGHATVPAAGQAEGRFSTQPPSLKESNCALRTGDAFVAAVAKGAASSPSIAGPDPKTDRSHPDGEGFQRQGNQARHRRRQQGDPERRREGPHPRRYGHVRQGAGCTRPAPATATPIPGVQLVVQNITFVDGSGEGHSGGQWNNGAKAARSTRKAAASRWSMRVSSTTCVTTSALTSAAARSASSTTSPAAYRRRPAARVDRQQHVRRQGRPRQLVRERRRAQRHRRPRGTSSTRCCHENTAVGHGAELGHCWRQRRRHFPQRRQRDRPQRHEQPHREQHGERGRQRDLLREQQQDRSSITIKDSITQNNPRGTFETPDLPGFYVIAKAPAQIVNSQILR